MVNPAGSPSVTGAAPVQTPPAAQSVASAETIVGRVIELIRQTDPQTAGKMDKAAIAKKLIEALADGKLTRDEFNKIFGTDFTEEAWNAFVGRNDKNADGEYVIQGDPAKGPINKDTALASFAYYLQVFEDFSKATDVAFSYFSRCTRITIIPREQMFSFMQSLFNAGPGGTAPIFDLVAKNRELVKRILQQAGILGSFDPRDYNNNLDALDKELVGALKGLMLHPQKKIWLEMLGFAFFNKFNEVAKEKGLRLDQLNLGDPLVASRFLNGVFRSYVTGTSAGSDITAEQYDALKTFSENMQKLRQFVGENPVIPGRGIKLNDLDPNSTEVDFSSLLSSAVRMIDEGKTVAEVLAVFKDCPAVAQPTNPGVAMPAQMPPITTVDPAALPPVQLQEPTVGSSYNPYPAPTLTDLPPLL